MNGLNGTCLLFSLLLLSLVDWCESTYSRRTPGCRASLPLAVPAHQKVSRTLTRSLDSTALLWPNKFDESLPVHVSTYRKTAKHSFCI